MKMLIPPEDRPPEEAGDEHGEGQGIAQRQQPGLGWRKPERIRNDPRRGPSQDAGNRKKGCRRSSANPAAGRGERGNRQWMGQRPTRQSRPAPSRAPCAPSAARAATDAARARLGHPSFDDVGRQHDAQVRGRGPRRRFGGRRRVRRADAQSRRCVRGSRGAARSSRQNSLRPDPSDSATSAPGRNPKLMCIAPNSDHIPPVDTPL